MIKALIIRHFLTILFLISWLFLFFSSVSAYYGNTYIYAIFSVAYLALLFIGIKCLKKSFSLFYFSILLWLGFWAKLAISLFLLGFFSFGEPVGGFDGSSSSWDEVLLIATIGALGPILAGFFLSWANVIEYTEAPFPTPPKWYKSGRLVIWPITFILIIGCSVFNAIYSIHQVGIVPQIVFFWPSNALLSWLLNIGLALIVSVLVAWEIASLKSVMPSVIAILVEAFSSSISVMSRAIFLFHTIPQFLSLAIDKKNRAQFTLSKILLLFIAISCLMYFSLQKISIMRDHKYIGNLAQKSQPFICNVESRFKEATPMGVWYLSQTCPGQTFPDLAVKSGGVVKGDSSPSSLNFTQSKTPSPPSFRSVLIYHLFVNRWIGLEGLMSAYAYQNKGIPLLVRQFLLERKIGDPDLYQEISNSGYKSPDRHFQFASLPGVIGFAYLSGCILCVFALVLIVCIFMVLSEKIMFFLTKNIIFCSVFGLSIANSLAQLGMNPSQDLKAYLATMIFAAVIWLLQADLQSH